MEEMVAPLIQVRLLWATHHAWKPRQTLQFAASGTALWLVTEGVVEMSDGQNSWQIQAGEAFLGSTASSRRIITHSGAQWLSLGLQIKFFDYLDLNHSLGLPAHWRPEPNEWESLTRCTQELVRLWHNGAEVRVDAASIAAYSQKMGAMRPNRAPMDLMIVQSLGRAIFGMCCKRLAKPEDSSVLGKRVPHWLAETLRQIDADPLVSVASLGQDSGFSPAQFRRSFREHIGVSPRTYLLNHRLDMARRLLQENELPVSTIATQCGFASQSHFIHIFKQNTGLPPFRYRQAAQSTPV